jgi:hypothetical protein
MLNTFLRELARKLVGARGWRRRDHAALVPPYEPPCCFSDLAEIRMLLGDPDESGFLAEGIARSGALSELDTHRDTLARLAAGVELAV